MSKYTQNFQRHKSKLVHTVTKLPKKNIKSLDHKKQLCVHTTKFILSRDAACTKDQKRRSRFEQRECNRKAVKAIFTCSAHFESKDILGYQASSQAVLKSRDFNVLALTSIGSRYDHRQSSVTMIRNRCVLTGRNNTVAKFGLSRICFRRHANLGYLPGVLKL